MARQHIQTTNILLATLNHCPHNNCTHLSSGKLNQEVVKVTVSQAYDVTDHAHDCSGAAVVLRGRPPLRGTR